MTFEEKLAAAAANFRDKRSAGDAAEGRSARQEPTFSDFDEEEYEEPERDTDYAAVYEDDDLEEDDLFDRAAREEDDDEGFTDTRETLRRAPNVVAGRAATTDYPQRDTDREKEATAEDYDEDAYEEDGYGEDAYEEEAYDEDYDDRPEDDRGRWPLGLIAVALVALLLLAAGGYGVVQERSAMQEQIRQLNDALATASSQAAEAGPDADRRALEQLGEERARTIEALTVENRRLTDMVAGLESQLEAQKLVQPPASGAVAARSAGPGPASPAPAKPAPAKPLPAGTAKAKSATTAPATAAPGPVATAEGAWFVNFGSYSQSAVARAWAGRIKPEAGEVVVTSADQDGASFYRVRVVGLPDRAAAEKVSRQLEAQYGLPKLWVGRE